MRFNDYFMEVERRKNEEQFRAKSDFTLCLHGMRRTREGLCFLRITPCKDTVSTSEPKPDSITFRYSCITPSRPRLGGKSQPAGQIKTTRLVSVPTLGECRESMEFSCGRCLCWHQLTVESRQSGGKLPLRPRSDLTPVTWGFSPATGLAEHSYGSVAFTLEGSCRGEEERCRGAFKNPFLALFVRPQPFSREGTAGLGRSLDKLPYQLWLGSVVVTT